MEKAGDLLRAFLDRLNIRDQHGYSTFFASWRRIVGDRLADHSDVVDVRNGALVVICDHPGWMQELQLRQHQVLTRVQNEFPQLGINAVQFKLVDDRVSAPKFQGTQGEQEQSAERQSAADGSQQAGPSPHGGAAAGETTGSEAARTGKHEIGSARASRRSDKRFRGTRSPDSQDPQDALSRIPEGRLKEVLGKLHERLEEEGPDGS